MTERELSAFIERVFAPRVTSTLFRDGTPIGRELTGEWRDTVEYRLAELGFGLRPDVTIRAVPHNLNGRPCRAQFRDNILFISAGAAEDGRFAPDFLRYDLPHALIDAPACYRNGSPEALVAARLAASYCSLVRLRGLPGLDASAEDLLDSEPDQLLHRIAEWALPAAADRVRTLLSGTLREVTSLARETLELAFPARERGQGQDGSPLPIIPVMPPYLTRFGLPARAVDWIVDAYGWTHTVEGWRGGFLPLQVRAILSGICDKDELLYKSGIVAAPTSAGKTLLAELRMLARWFDSGAHVKKTVFLVPTREIGLERAAAFRAAYGTRGTERRLRVCYSDGEHTHEDGAIRDGRFDVAILVNEKLKPFVQSSRFFKGVAEVVLDEAQVMSEPGGRGAYLEMAMMTALRSHEHMSVLGLTRPSEGLEPVLQALDLRGKGAFHLETTRRPVAMLAGIWAPQTKTAIYRDCNTHEPRKETLDLGYPGDILQTLKTLLFRFVKRRSREKELGRRNNLLIAVPTKTDTLRLSHWLAQLAEIDPEVREILDENRDGALLEERLQGMEPSTRRAGLSRVLRLGIGWHDADLSKEERAIVGDAFRDGEICILVSTRTMAQGVNLPAQTIVFLNWGRKPGSGPRFEDEEDNRLAFWRGLEAEYVTWLGRVGRFGKPASRVPTALYLTHDAPGSEEYVTIERLNAEQRGPFKPTLKDLYSFGDTTLSAITAVTHATGRPPTADEVVEFLAQSPSGMEARDREGMETRARLALLELLEGTEEGSEESPALIRAVDRDGEEAYELADLGVIAHSSGVQMDTIRRLYAWLAHEATPRKGWDLFDVLAVCNSTVDGKRFQTVRPSKPAWDLIREAYDYHLAEAEGRLGPEWAERSPVLQARISRVKEQALFLALRDWRAGEPLYDEHSLLAGIETRYGLEGAGCSLYEKSREYARLLRVAAAVAEHLPEGRHPEARPEELPPLAAGVVSIPHDLETLGEEIRFGVPAAAIPLARLGVAGLSRTWCLSLLRAVDDAGIAPDLPLLERLKLLIEGQPEAFAAALPTPGLAQRVLEAVTAHDRQPLAEQLSAEPDRAPAFYSRPFVVQAHLMQGQDRYTCLRVRHQRLYSVMRRNVSQGVPIAFKTAEDLAHWRDRGAVEILAEIGRYYEDGYRIDQFLVDLDAKNDYPLDSLTTVAREIHRRLAAHEWVDADRTEIRWTGHRGFHIVAPFQNAAGRSVESVKRALEAVLRKIVNDTSVFLKEMPLVSTPYVILDLSPVMQRGVYRNAWSLHAGTAQVCVPVEPGRLEQFDPDVEATHEAVAALLDRIEPGQELSGLTYPELLGAYWEAAREAYPTPADLPPLRRVRVRQVPASPAIAPIVEQHPFRPAAWPPLRVTTEAGLAALLPELAGAERVGLDIEATGYDDRRYEVRLLSLATLGLTAVIDCRAVSPAPVLAALAGKELVGHNISYDLGFLWRQFGLEPPQAWDTMLLSRLLHAGQEHPGRGFHSLQGCVRRVLGYHLPKELQASNWTGALTPEQVEYSALDAAVLLPLLGQLLQSIEKAGLSPVAELERRALPAVVWLSQSGVPVDRERWEQLSARAATEVACLRVELDSLAPPAPGYHAGAGWNWDSPHSVREALRTAGCDVRRTDDETLAGLEHPLAELIRRYRTAQRLASTYGEKWLRFVEGERVYPDWRQVGTTGKLSSRDPDVQHVPTGEYRTAIAAPAERVLVRADYGQLELRIAAHVANEERVKDAFRRGLDLHVLTAQTLLARTDLTEEDRQFGKVVNYAMLYAMEAEGLRRKARADYGIWLAVEEAEQYRSAYFSLYPGFREWHVRTRRERRGETRSLLGRRRVLPDDAPDAVRLNSPIQGSGADIIKTALALLWERRGECPGAVPIIASTDEIVLECDEAQGEAAAVWLQQLMLEAFTSLLPDIPPVVTVRVGPTWGDAEHGQRVAVPTSQPGTTAPAGETSGIPVTPTPQSTPEAPLLEIYTDASVQGTDAGFGALALFGGRTRELGGRATVPEGASQAAELLAVRAALASVAESKRARFVVALHTDSDGVVRALDGGSLRGFEDVLAELRGLLRQFAGWSVRRTPRSDPQLQRAHNLARAYRSRTMPKGETK